MKALIETNDATVKRVALAAFPDYSGRLFKVGEFTPGMSVASFWDSGSRDFYACVHLETLQGVAIPQNGTPFDGVLAAGAIVSELPLNVALVRRAIVLGKERGLTVFVRPENLASLIPAQAASNLTWAQRVVLSAARGLKPAFRVDAAQRDCGLGASAYATAKAELIAKGFLNSAGAITADGKNAIGWVDLHALAREKPAGV